MRLTRPLDANQANTPQSNQPGSYPTLASPPFKQAPVQRPQNPQHQSAFQPRGMNPVNEVQASTWYRPDYPGSKPGLCSQKPGQSQQPWLILTPTPSQSMPAQTEATVLQDSMARLSPSDAPETQRRSVNRASGFRAAEHDSRGRITMPPEQSELQHRIQSTRKAATNPSPRPRCIRRWCTGRISPG